MTAVVLAAGRSTRMAPVNKLTVDYQGAALVRRAAEAAIASRAAEVVVVVGHEAEAVRDVLSGLDLRVVANPDYATGLASSVKAGIAAVGAEATGAVILLGDMPGVTSAVVDALICAFEGAGGQNICQPRYDGRPGNPVLWPRRLFAEFANLSGDVGAKPLLARHKTDVLGVDVGTDAIHMDIDAPADLGA
ncbi:MAG: nucleotidyltransferase family protein [Rhodospirillales bacterium]